jgi:hypothetical protein
VQLPKPELGVPQTLTDLGLVGSAGTHVTLPAPGKSMHALGLVSPPQQSASVLQMSPWIRQPPAGWQMVEPVVPNWPQ